jgi:hypothetical protein
VFAASDVVGRGESALLEQCSEAAPAGDASIVWASTMAATTSARWREQFEWFAHAPTAHDVIAAIEQQNPPFANGDERTVHDLASRTWRVRRE